MSMRIAGPVAMLTLMAAGAAVGAGAAKAQGSDGIGVTECRSSEATSAISAYSE